MRRSYAEASDQVEEARKNLQARQSERERAEHVLREARRVLVNQETGQVQAKAHLAEINNRLENLRRTLQNYHTSIGIEEKAVEEAQIRLNKAKDYRSQADEEVEQLEEEITVQRRQLTALENERRYFPGCPFPFRWGLEPNESPIGSVGPGRTFLEWVGTRRQEFSSGITPGEIKIQPPDALIPDGRAAGI